MPFPKPSLLPFPLLLLLLIAFSTYSYAANDPCAVATAASCPVTCFRTDPVCGEDGNTFWCGCAEAACSGVRVARRGFCEVGNGGVSGQALLLVHIVWLIVLGFSVVLGLL
ncbi:Kazal-type serine protease inhibitors protein [Dioscorea alata]|uniref:Kazal-type serine protease inhibitors protein n=1 Tax=Dioscorea alata TaxID=55571 RepID=A0ACB7TZQ8_DIOAL|nr:Kazal-type serine protease inhibitors protein [Dioscorea alata]